MLVQRTFSSFILVSSFFFSSFSAFAENLKWNPSLIQGQLENGFNYVAYQSSNAKEPFNLRLIVNAGSVDDEKEGMAHIVEHMVFRANRAHEIDMHRFFDDIGWKTGKEINAMTRQSETQYMLRTRPQDALNIEESVKLLSDLAFGAKMIEKEWQIERGVILEEMRKGMGVAERVNTAKKEIVRNGSRYVDRPTIGTKAGVNAITITDIRDFYHSFYVPSNMTLVASGHFDARSFVHAVNTYFGAQAAKPAPKRDYVELPLKDDLVIGKVQDEKGTTSAVVYGFRNALKAGITEEGAYQRLQNYFLRKLVMPMVRNAKSEYEQASTVSLTFSEPTNERLILAMSAKTNNHDLGLQIVLNEIERLRQVGIEESEFLALKQEAKAIIERNKIAISKRDFAKWEDKLVSAVMQETAEEDYEVKAARNLKWIDEMTVESLNQRLQELLSAPDQFMFYQVPGGIEKSLPTKKEVLALAQNTAKQKFTLLAHQANKNSFIANNSETPKVALPEIASLTLAPAKLISKHEYFSPNVVHWQLANGDNVVWLNKETPKNTLYIKALSKAGYQNEKYSPWLLQSAQQIWSQSDYTSMTNEQLMAWQKANKATWSWAQKSLELDLSAMVANENLNALMQAYYIMQTQWQLTDASFVEVKESLQHSIKASSEQDVQTNALWGIMHASTPSKQDIDNLSIEQFKQSIQVLNKEPVSLFIVGKSSEADIEQNVLPFLFAIERQTNLQANKPKLPKGKNTLIQSVHDEDKSTVTIKSESDMLWSPENAFLVSTLNPIMQKALKNRLRHELGGLYSMRFEMSLDKDDKVRMLTSFTTAPEKAQMLIEAHNEVLNSIALQLSKENYTRIQEDIQFAESLRLEDTNTWLRRLSLSFEKYQNPDYLRSMLTLNKSVTESTLNELVKEFIPVSKQAVLIGTPKQ